MRSFTRGLTRSFTQTGEDGWRGAYRGVGSKRRGGTEISIRGAGQKRCRIDEGVMPGIPDQPTDGIHMAEAMSGMRAFDGTGGKEPATAAESATNQAGMGSQGSEFAEAVSGLGSQEDWRFTGAGRHSFAPHHGTPDHSPLRTDPRAGSAPAGTPAL